MTSKSFTVLVVDDIPLMRLMFSKYVRSAGPDILRPALGDVEIEVIEAGDGEEAGRLLQKHDVDLLLLDLMMPVKDGLTLLREIRANSRLNDLEVIVCSAMSEKNVMEEAMKVGASAYIVKPFTLSVVKKTLQDIFTDEVTT